MTSHSMRFKSDHTNMQEFEPSNGFTDGFGMSKDAYRVNALVSD